MSLQQKTYVDFKNLGDTGTSSSTSIQPVTDGEDATASVFGRPSENLRSRTEISRTIAEDLLYYRDRSYRYLMDLTAGGSLTWAGVGTGIVNNTTQLVLRPFLTPRTNQKGSLSIGTAAVNQLIYAVAASAYATDGVNAVTVEHRAVAGTTTPSVTISTGPVYRILVIFDSANTGHTASVVAPLVTTAIAGSGLAGKLTCTANGAAGNAILALSETSIDTKSHGAGTAGTATADVEAHSLAANALQTFTTSNPLQEGDLLAIRYDYRVEPTGGDANDPKGGVPGGRAESNQSRSNADVSANLFLAQTHPEWLPGCIPLCKVVNGNLHWLDGTVLAAGAAGAPGTTLSSYVNSSAWSGATTLVYNGGISNSASVDTPQEAFDSVDTRLSTLRSVTWTVTDNSYSRGGHYNSAGFGIDQAIAATQGSGINGGVVYVRRGQYSGCFASGSMTIDGLSLHGEAPDVLLTLGATNTYTNTAKVSIENVTLDRASSAVLGIGGDVSLRNVTFLPGMLRLGTSSTAVASLDRCKMTAASISAGTTYGVSFEGLRVHATNSDFVGPDGSVASGGSVVNFGANVQSAVFDNCTFSMQSANTLISFTSPGANTAAQGIVFRKCTFTGGTSTSYLLTVASSLTNGNLIFEDCTFTNTTSSPLVSLTTVKNVTFNGCTLNTGTSVATGATYGTAFKLRSNSSQGLTKVVNCQMFVGQLDGAAASNIPFVLFGDSTTSNAGGSRYEVDGLVITLLSSVTALSPASLLQVKACGVVAETPGTVARITLDLNGKTFNANTQQGGLLALTGVTDFVTSRPLRVTARDVTITNMAGASVTGVTGLFVDAVLCTLSRLTTRAASTAAPAAQFQMANYSFLGGTRVTDAQLVVFGTSNNPVRVAYSVDGGIPRVYRMSVLDAYGTFAGFGVVYLSRGVLDECTVDLGSMPGYAVDSTGGSSIRGGYYVTAASASGVVRLDNNGSLTGARVGNSNGTNAVDAAGSVARCVVVGNTLGSSTGTPTIGANITGGTGAQVAYNALVVSALP